jgi:hypothetical protein
MIMNLRPACAIQKVQGQSQVLSEALFPKTKINKKHNQKTRLYFANYYNLTISTYYHEQHFFILLW